ncbi:MAG: hypothetical protein ACFE9L_11050 [Candidatus Hodarchaeota archaeon]
MGRVQENLQYSLRTIMNEIPPLISLYSDEDQEHLNRFLEVIQHYEEVSFKRNTLVKRFQTFRLKILKTDLYLQLPFYWFVGTFFKNALILLKVSKFHANKFYEYIIHTLRGSSNKEGVYQLIRDRICLKDLAWEELQKNCIKFLISLTEDQFNILNAIYSSILDEGINVLGARKLRAAILDRVNIQRKKLDLPELKRFFSLLECEWFIRFSSLSFGLERIFFQFQLQKSTPLEAIINFQDQKNRSLCTSDVYKVTNTPNTYLGILYVPTLDLKRLETYLHELEKQDILILKDFQR